MTLSRRHLELLAPARDADIGIAAINHGADAVYLGGPEFGARAKAGNSMADIARLVDYAHRFHARIYVTINTILHDSELTSARNLAWQCFDVGVDALIVQDMGLLEMDLPPIQLHASTQTDIRTVEKAAFLDQVGFSQMVLAREMDLQTIRQVARATEGTLEFFVHGALCVAFSGQCYISYAHSGRSANRGECAQECRLPYTLEDAQGRILAKDKHLLSMKDNDQSANLRALIEAGVSSFKIEGRYKDMAYVKNCTAYYRQLLDQLLEEMPGYAASSSGRCAFNFTPQPEKTFNRTTTEYFIHGRGEDVGAFDTPKFAGERIGRVTKVGEHFFEVETEIALHNGDGVCFLDVHQDLVGLRVNTVEGKRLYPNEMPVDLRPNTRLYRNRDHAYLRHLEKATASRNIPVTMILKEAHEALLLEVTDADGFAASAQSPGAIETAENPEQAEIAIRQALAKLGNSDFSLVAVTLSFAEPRFVPASRLNQLRREVIQQLVAKRHSAYQRPARQPAALPPARYPEDALSYLANVYNQKARQFYEKHGVKLIDAAYEAHQELGEVPLMVTKHCLRYSFALCPKEAKGVLGVQGTVTAEPMTLVNGKERITLKFDCKRCEMHVMGKIRKQMLALPAPQPVHFYPKTLAT